MSFKILPWFADNDLSAARDSKLSTIELFI